MTNRTTNSTAPAVITRRAARLKRTTHETDVSVSLVLGGGGVAQIGTGIGFLDHMLTLLAAHAGFDLTMTCAGDLAVDDHHTVEDCAIVLGRSLDQALGDRSGVARYGASLIPMDEALARCAVDLVVRPCAVVDLGIRRESLGGLAAENLTHFFRTLASEGRFTLHLDVLKGENDHHRAEAAFKALAAALREAAALRPREGGRPATTKGVMA